MRKKLDISKSKLIEHIYVDKMTQVEIANKYGSSRASVYRLQKKYDIASLEDYQRRYSQNLTDIQKEFIYGTVLGDACIYHHKTCNYSSIMFCHSIAQKEYVELKFNILKDFVRKDKITKIVRDGGGRYGFSTGAHPCFSEIKKEFYNGTKKFVSYDILKKLTPISLAFWFMDDGSRCKNRGLAIHTNCFELFEVEMICKWFWDELKVYCNPQKRAENQYVVFFSNRTSEKFSQIILPWVLPSMRYKFEGIFLKNPQRLYAIPFCLQNYLNTEDKV